VVSRIEHAEELHADLCDRVLVANDIDAPIRRAVEQVVDQFGVALDLKVSVASGGRMETSLSLYSIEHQL
jgi:hypothetical protein